MLPGGLERAGEYIAQLRHTITKCLAMAGWLASQLSSAAPERTHPRNEEPIDVNVYS